VRALPTLFRVTSFNGPSVSILLALLLASDAR
jgi:hypothetical protein